MKNKIIFHIIAFLIITGSVFAQSSSGRFSLKDIDSYWQSSIVTEYYKSSYIPKNRPFGTSFYWGDSTGYIVFSKGIYMQDSLKVAKDLYVGVKGGKVFLDTSRSGVIQYSGNSFLMSNSKSNGNFEITNSGSNSGFVFTLGERNSTISFNKLRGGITYSGIVSYDTANGLYIGEGNIYLAGGTQQIKLPKDTVSDYASADAVTINRQSGTVTTKSLTTASGDDYTITINNSLVSATTNVWAMIKTNSGSGAPLVRQCATGSGTVTVIIRNLGSGSLNSAISFQFLLVN